MNELIKPVRYGILIGLLGLVFGMGWAFWLVLGHERIHKSLEMRAAQGIYQQGRAEKSHRHAEESKPQLKEEGHTHMMEEDQHVVKMRGNEHQHSEGEHDSPVMEAAHERLRRGHIHAMGLGLLAIAISFILAFTNATDRIKTVASMLTGLGGLIYPFAWIVMGYRTPGLGPDAAEASVTIIAGPGVSLVFLGIFTAGIFLLKDIFLKK